MSDRQLISYPKSGRTWLRYILTQLDLVRYVEFHHDGFEFSDPRMEPHNFDRPARLRRYAEQRIVYLERDPRDVMVSLYFQITGRMRDIYDYQGTISAFLRDEYFGAGTLKQFREMWAELAPALCCLKVTYEECHRDMTLVTQRILGFYGFEIPRARLSEVITAAQFERMRLVEQTRKVTDPWLRPRNEAPKLRRGKVGGFREELSEADIAYLDSVFGDQL